MKTVADYIKENKHQIIDHWEEKVNQEITASGTTSSMVLRNLLPNLLDDVAEAMLITCWRKTSLKKTDAGRSSGKALIMAVTGPPPQNIRSSR